MVRKLISKLGGPGLSPGSGYCVVFLGKTPNSHSASLNPGASMGTGVFSGWVTHFTLTVPLSAQVCKLTVAKLMLGGGVSTLAMD